MPDFYYSKHYNIMDLFFSNRIASSIHLYCVQQYGQPETYTNDPVRFRQNIENCFFNVIEQHNSVMAGITQFYQDYPQRSWYAHLKFN